MSEEAPRGKVTVRHGSGWWFVDGYIIRTRKIKLQA